MEVSNPLLNRYFLLQKIGKGGMGEVYKAKDQVDNKIVAVKLLHSHMQTGKYISRFKREAEYLSKLSHPNIVKFYSFEQDEKAIFLVMEYIVGRKIRNHISLSNDPIKDMIKFAIQISDALEYAHSMNLIHRDIKPDNILINSHLDAKVLDFGIARGLPNETKLTDPGTLIGTVQYLSPEYIQGANLTSMSDLYSFGVTIYELLTQRLPFTEGKSGEVFFPQLYEDPTPPSKYNSKLSGELERIILKLLEKDPAKRFQSAKALKECFKAIQ